MRNCLLRFDALRNKKNIRNIVNQNIRNFEDTLDISIVPRDDLVDEAENSEEEEKNSRVIKSRQKFITTWNIFNLKCNDIFGIAVNLGNWLRSKNISLDPVVVVETVFKYPMELSYIPEADELVYDPEKIYWYIVIIE